MPPSAALGKSQTNWKDIRNQTKPEKFRYVSRLIGLKEGKVPQKFIHEFCFATYITKQTAL